MADNARLNEFTPAPFYWFNRLLGKSLTNQKRVRAQACNCYIFVKLPTLSGLETDERPPAIHPYQRALLQECWVVPETFFAHQNARDLYRLHG
jgi:hypothetical protein